ncbi:retrograde regulation protein 2 [Ophidiomyces ophidiicola]|nr:retrograde regulation protein 2 [Ophidiomyces ophidiicola]
MSVQENPNLFALIDMGSNGIRFSISDLCPLTSRILPTVFQGRAAISLYDAQFFPGNTERQPISVSVQESVFRHLVRFKQTCKDFGVLENNIAFLATEATRTAINSAEFLSAIKDRTGWNVSLLPKEEEGELGAMGIASSLASVKGLVMDLGGGSTQITWMIANGGSVRTSTSGPISFPYGAAAVTKRLEEAEGDQKIPVIQKLQIEMIGNFERAFHELDIPDELWDHVKTHGGFDLFLSGGGFRGWGYLLLSQSKVNPYPVPIINGFRADCSDFSNTTNIASLASLKGSTVFGVSKRRASQVPAVACLVKSLVTAIPHIKSIHFCQGGVREGYLFRKLPAEVRAKDPLVMATTPYSTASSGKLSLLLQNALPGGSLVDEGTCIPSPFTGYLLQAFTNFMFVHSSVSKESRAAVALHSTTSGLLAATHGISHVDRTLLALLLYYRWQGDLCPPDESFLHRLQQIISAEEAWWCQYIGRVAAFVGEIYPSGIIREATPRVSFSTGWSPGKKGRPIVSLNIKVPDQQNPPCNDADWLTDEVSRITKVGKKKNWAIMEGAGERWGLKVEVLILQHEQ